MTKVYGLDLDEIKITEEVGKAWVKFLKEYPVAIDSPTDNFAPYSFIPHQEFEAYKENMCSKETPVSEVFELWVDALDDDGITLAQILAAIIEKYELVRLMYSGSILGCPHMCPWDFPKTMQTITEEQFIGIMTKFIKKIQPDKEVVLSDYEVD